MRILAGPGRGIAALAVALALLLGSQGCGVGAVLLLSAAGGAVAMSGEPQRLSNTQGQDFDEQRVARVRSEAKTPEDVLQLLGHPQTKTFTDQGEEWSYRYYVPPSMLRSGSEKLLLLRFRDGKVQEVRYSISAL
jgi:hypothetical protein